jgi:hypothetical protein
MSSLMAVMEQRSMLFAVDSAHSKVVCDMKTKEKKISRYLNDDVEKIHNIGKDIAFVSGANYVIDPVIEKLNDFLDRKKRINTEELKQYLVKTYPYSNCPIKDYGLSDIGIVILRVINNEAIMIKLDQCSDFVPVVTKTNQGEVKLSVDGFDNKRIYENGSKFLNRLPNFGWRSPEALITIYQNNYSEGVGGTIKVYKFDWSGCNFITSQKLEEKNLRYISIDENGNEVDSNDKLEFKSCLQACTGTFTGTVQAGQVIGGTVEGATINGSTINGTVINGCTINGGEFYSDNPSNAQATTIEGGQIITNALVCDGGLGYQFLAVGNYLQMWKPSVGETFHLNGDGHLMCKALDVNGASLITTSNKDYYTYNPAFHRQDSYTITPSLTAAQNISLYGEPNAASTWWCNATFELKSASDFRLKKNIKSFEDLPDELYFELKPKQFEYKVDEQPKGICFGLLAQQVISAFERYGLNALDYNLVEKTKARNYTDEVLYVKDEEMYRINYQNFHAWTMYMVQNLFSEKVNLNNRVTKLEQQISKLVGSEG